MSGGKFWRTAEDRIQKAMEDGEFDDLPGKGKPLNLDENLAGEKLLLDMLRRKDAEPAHVEKLREVRRLRRLLKDDRGELSPADRERIATALGELEDALRAMQG